MAAAGPGLVRHVMPVAILMIILGAQVFGYFVTLTQITQQLVAWISSLVYAGYLFGNIPWVKLHLEKIIWGLILVPGCLALFGAWRAGRAESGGRAG